MEFFIVRNTADDEKAKLIELMNVIKYLLKTYSYKLTSMAIVKLDQLSESRLSKANY